MESEGSSVGGSIPVPDELRGWIEEEAERNDVTPEEYVRELIAAHRAVEEDGPAVAAVGEDDLEDLRAEFQELIEDVRERVVQVARDVDAKADANHAHPELAANLQRVEGGLDRTESELRGDLEAVRDDLEAGFENYEEILEYLLETTERLESRADTVAKAVLETRTQLRDLTGEVRRREAVDELKRTAASEGVQAARCEECGEEIRVALLAEPECPDCAGRFVDVEPKRGFLGSHELIVGQRPPLAGNDETSIDEELSGTFDDDGRSVPDLNGRTGNE